MLDISSDIQPLSSFKRDSVTLIGQLKRTGRPVVLTINGKAEVVVQDAKSYQQMLELVDRAEAVVGIRKGLASMARGEGIPAEKAFDRLRKKYNIRKTAMKYKLIIQPPALADLDEASRWIAERSPETAARWSTVFSTSCKPWSIFRPVADWRLKAG